MEPIHGVFPFRLFFFFQLEENLNRTKDVWNVEPPTAVNYWVEAVLTWFNARRSKGNVR